MVSSINSDSSLYSLLSQSGTNASGKTATDDMFAKLTKDLSGDGKTITKSQLESYIAKVEADTSGTEEKGKLGFLKQLDKNWDKISGGSDSITSAQLTAGASYLQPPTQGEGNSQSLFSALSDAVGASSSGITKDNLTSYLKSLINSLSSDSDSDSDSDSTTSTSATSSTSSKNSDSSTSTTSTTDTEEVAKEIKLLTNLLANFDNLSNSDGYITASSLKSGLKEPQDPSTVTSSQLTSPVDLRV